jgi:hypothetical protein
MRSDEQDERDGSLPPPSVLEGETDGSFFGVGRKICLVQPNTTDVEQIITGVEPIVSSSRQIIAGVQPIVSGVERIIWGSCFVTPLSGCLSRLSRYLSRQSGCERAQRRTQRS